MSLSPRPEMLTITTSDCAHLGGALDALGYGVGGLEGADDSFEMGELAEGVERFLVVGGDVFGAALIVQPGVLGSDGRVVESGGDGVGEGDLSGGVLQQIRVGSLQDAGAASAFGVEAGGVLAEGVAAASGFDADERDAGVVEEGVEDADGVGASADAGDDGGGELGLRLSEFACAPLRR